MIHRTLQNVVYMKKSRCSKKNKKIKKGGGGQHLKKKKGSNIGSCPQVPVILINKMITNTHSFNFQTRAHEGQNEQILPVDLHKLRG